MSFRQITDPAEIEKTMRAYMLEPEKQPSRFIPAIHQRPGEDWNGWTVTPGGNVIEGARVTACAVFEPVKDTLYTLADEKNRSFGAIRLSGISKLELLR